MSAGENIYDIVGEKETPRGIGLGAGIKITDKLRKELEGKGLKGFKRGGKVKKTGLAKLHKGERVLTAKQAKKVTLRKAPARKMARKR